jgi:hypothetical protein
VTPKTFSLLFLLFASGFNTPPFRAFLLAKYFVSSGIEPAYNPFLTEPTYPSLQGGVVDYPAILADFLFIVYYR